MKRYKLEELPKGVCFSNDIVMGSYYEDTERGGKTSYHSYDMDGNIKSSFACPRVTSEWYLSDKYGNEIVGLSDTTVWQYLMWSKNLNRFIISTDYYKNDMEFLQDNPGVQEFEKLERTKKKEKKKVLVKYQYLYQNKYNNVWELSCPLTKCEAFEKKLFSAKKLEETRTYE